MKISFARAIKSKMSPVIIISEDFYSKLYHRRQQMRMSDRIILDIMYDQEPIEFYQILRLLHRNFEPLEFIEITEGIEIYRKDY